METKDAKELTQAIDEKPLTINPHVRWMIRRDMPTVLAIESECFEFPWGEEDFVRCLRQRNCIGMVAEFEEQVVGFMIYELHKTRLHLLGLAVSPLLQRQGIGSVMMQKLLSKLCQQRRHTIACEVRESNLKALYFMKACGLRAVKVLRGYYEESDEDAYLMRYRLNMPVATMREAIEEEEAEGS